jgi:hypothetical protein
MNLICKTRILSTNTHDRKDVMILEGIVIFILLLSFAVATFWIYMYEKREFNNGVCPRCGEYLELFDIDSQGGRGYTCPRCHKHHCWISFNIDEEHMKRRKK